MARRGCASGRRKQLRRLVKALHEHKDFDPSIFDRAAPTPPPPPPPAYRGFVPPKLEAKVVKATPALTPRSRAPARPLASDVAPVRRLTRPLPVSAQIKKRGTEITKSVNKPTIISIETTNYRLRQRGSRILINRRIPPIPQNVTTGDSGGMPGIPV